ncbi:VOC family protein [Paenarthrobacter aurescens]|uniref:VOC domain-containing protein n=1 Tax=Paenarthrobacter aurescens TaxID=43663 RepID=A0A4Y3NDD2_PAEAU|nr:VOC family protein [Paenarthrobacter aurescens]UKA50231.1 VOC family protein [Arthrobacter sp. FW305-123]MDO6141964.1 VOC family protein [Paenarthrobacter aurescens]MDO6145769.1 VOC family protein [Paenarthrobacter aurescens]MDO6157013.1 VOC family protein [Paenarthrobacter aurescens]MDO6160999.1 VOC family protein [Paenarthrobacter aurescens]
MTTSIFVNLPVSDLEASKNFYTALGYTINPNFSDETAACVVFSDTIFTMLLTHDKFSQYTKQPIADTQNSTAAIVAISADSREDVDSLAAKALEAGGSETYEPMDMGFMYGRAFRDLDGHHWEVVWMDSTAAQDGPPES